MSLIKPLLWINLLLAVSALIAAGWCFSFYLEPHPHDRHGGTFGLLGAGLYGVFSLSFVIAAAALWKNWPGRWLLQILPWLGALLLLTI